MKNLHLIPTDKPSRLFYNKKDSIFTIDNDFENVIEEDWFQDYNIYITSDEEIKEGDIPCWVISDIKTAIPHKLKDYQYRKLYTYKKIILTTDQDLIKDGVQNIDDEFLEWFVKNPSCEQVKVFQEIHHFGEVVDESYPEGFFDYKIIIPKEEQKELRRKLFTLIKSLEQEEPKKETLEEFIKEVLNEEFFTNISEYRKAERLMELGAKWQQERSYSEEDMISFANFKISNLMTHCDKKGMYLGTKVVLEIWFEKFKKK